MLAVPATWPDFESQVIKWLGTCVTSRTNATHREITLVRASRTIRPLWRALAKGKPARIVPRYDWGQFRLQRVEFSSPQASGQVAPGSLPGVSGPETKTPSARSAGNTASKMAPGTGRPGIHPPPTAPDVDLHVPHEGQELIFDGLRLVERLRTDGRQGDADDLERTLETAQAVLISLAELAGVYYIGIKVRAGKLLVMWGWNATGPAFRRIGARLERLQPQLDSALANVVDTAQPHVPRAGAGLDWKVLDQLVDPTVPAQLDDAACGPACVQILLRERGIEVAQDELILRARATIHPEIKSRRVAGAALVKLLSDLDPAGGWTYLSPFRSRELLENKTPRQIIEVLGAKGAWIAQVGAHFVVVDGFDRVGYLRVRDPWYEPGIARGIRAGSHYRVSMKTFFENWYAVAVYRR